LTGPGGVGTTRLALEVARRADDALPGGARFVALAPLREAGEVLRELEALPEMLTEPTLVVLDNFEHVMDASPAVAALVAGAPAVRVIVTSRERLSVRGEREIALEPLAVDDAVELFGPRA